MYNYCPLRVTCTNWPLHLSRYTRVLFQVHFYMIKMIHRFFFNFHFLTDKSTFLLHQFPWTVYTHTSCTVDCIHCFFSPPELIHYVFKWHEHLHSSYHLRTVNRPRVPLEVYICINCHAVNGTLFFLSLSLCVCLFDSLCARRGTSSIDKCMCACVWKENS